MSTKSAMSAEHENNKENEAIMTRHWRGFFQDWIFVEKKGLLTTSWKRYWCAIGKTGMLYVFKQADSPRAWAAVDLVTSFVKDVPNDTPGIHEFEVHTGQPPKCALKVRVNGADQKAEWVNALREIMGKHRGDWKDCLSNGQITRPRRNTD